MTDPTPYPGEPRRHEPASWPPPQVAVHPQPSGQFVSPRYPASRGSQGSQGHPAYPHEEPVPYYLMLRNWNYRWWKPLAGLGLLLVLALAVQVLVAGAIFALAALQPGAFSDNLAEFNGLEQISPSFLLLLNLSLGAMILVTWVVMRVMHQMRPRWLTSVAPRMRWRFFGACVGLSVVALIAQTAVGLVLPGDELDVAVEVNDFTTTTAVLALVVLLTTPLQAAGEEYFFRGYVLQALGSLLGFSPDRWVQLMAKWTALVVTSLLFALAHGVQNFPLFFDRFAFGMIAGWLVIRTGGLEAGIAIHILNNFLAFGLALTVGDLGESLNVSEISWWNILVTLTQAVVYAALVVWAARRMGIRSTTDRPVLEAAEVPAAALT